MSMTDPIADFLTQIRNAQVARHGSVEVPYSRIKSEIARVLQEEGYINGQKVNKKKPFQTLTVVLRYDSDSVPVIRFLQRVSRPGRRIYTGKDTIPTVLGGLGTNILSTPNGVMAGKRARKEGVGGEIVCEVY